MSPPSLDTPPSRGVCRRLCSCPGRRGFSWDPFRAGAGGCLATLVCSLAAVLTLLVPKLCQAPWALLPAVLQPLVLA